MFGLPVKKQRSLHWGQNWDDEGHCRYIGVTRFYVVGGEHERKDENGSAR